MAANYPGITFATDSTAEVNKYVPQMQAAGCDFIILSYHSGMGSTGGTLSFGTNTENQIARVIANTTGVDMVIAGHDHSTGYSNSTYKNAGNKDVLVVNGGGTQLTQSVFTATLQYRQHHQRRSEKQSRTSAWQIIRTTRPSKR